LDEPATAAEAAVSSSSAAKAAGAESYTGSLEDAVLHNANQFHKWHTELEAACASETEEKYKRYAGLLGGYLASCDGLQDKVGLWESSSALAEQQAQQQAETPYPCMQACSCMQTCVCRTRCVRVLAGTASANAAALQQRTASKDIRTLHARLCMHATLSQHIIVSQIAAQEQHAFGVHIQLI
jgi:hypothetical protein